MRSSSFSFSRLASSREAAPCVTQKQVMEISYRLVSSKRVRRAKCWTRPPRADESINVQYVTGFVISK
jgi:UDP-N-acetyl-D-mannosaminuronic acid transferase (WecB/TagA/CpsF family)